MWDAKRVCYFMRRDPELFYAACIIRRFDENYAHAGQIITRHSQRTK